MTYKELFLKATRLLEHSQITLGEYEEMTKPLDREVEPPTRKGKWLRMSDLSEQEDDRYKCSRCGNVIHYKNKMDLYTFNSWCGRCGSDNGEHINYEVEE